MIDKHTPGPWHLSVDDDLCIVQRPNGQTDLGYVVAKCMKLVLIRSPATTRANARLIAAAPDLLAMVKTLADVLEFDGCGSALLIAGARDLVATATGAES